jgi:hypothetical protein
MKVIQHSVFAESSEWPILSIFASGVAARRARGRERIRERAEAFINEIGIQSVVSVSEHASTLGPFSVVVWWYRELPPDTETLVIRPSDESKTA